MLDLIRYILYVGLFILVGRSLINWRRTGNIMPFSSIRGLGQFVIGLGLTMLICACLMYALIINLRRGDRSLPDASIALMASQTLLQFLPDGRHAVVQDSASGGITVYDLGTEATILTSPPEAGRVSAVFPLADGMLAVFSNPQEPFKQLLWWDLTQPTAAPLVLPLPPNVWQLRAVLDQGDRTTALLQVVDMLNYIQPIYSWNWRTGTVTPAGYAGLPLLPLAQSGSDVILLDSNIFNLLDPTTLKPVASLPLSKTMNLPILATDPGGTVAVVASGEDTQQIRGARVTAYLYGLHPLQLYARPLIPDLLEVEAVAVSPDGSLVAVAGRGDGMMELQFDQIWIYSIPTGEKVTSLYGHNRTVTALQFTPDGKGLWSAGDTNELRFWRMDGAR